ncbi:MAG: transporter permease [Verrucomicrobia bacterium]|jgi:phospholipid/cholesterol/gamma-HCH transport system permease protein|nr:transporter permease [Verrucomicrobiota bacterium]
MVRLYLDLVGRAIIGFADTARGLGAFALITLGTTLSKFGFAKAVIRPLILKQIYESGLKLLPMIAFLGVALGFVIIGQTVALLTSVGAQGFTGPVMVAVVVRELGPLTTALIVLARVGTTTVIELGMSRATGEIEALEALGIDPIHLLVVPRVIGQAVAIFALTIYLILIALISGYAFVMVQNVPLTPAAYAEQLAMALTWQDFMLVALKTLSFGAIIAVVTCYQGLAQPLRLEQVAQATSKAVVAGTIGCVLVDAIFITLFLFV